jgi:hypothetical protein
MSNEFRKWLAFGTGVGIEIGARDLRVVVVRVRPTGIDLTGDMVIERYAERPAAEWGAAYAGFLKSAGASHLAAWVVLPRHDVIVRQLVLPGVEEKDMAAAISYQIDSLHPYSEEEAVYAWAPAGPGGSVLIGISTRAVIDRYVALFAEAGVKISALTFSAAAIYSSLRVLGAPASSGFLAMIHHEAEGEMEAYGESPSRPVFSASFDLPSPAFAQRARSLALAELRLPDETESRDLSEVVPKPRSVPEAYQFAPAAMAYATAVAAACPRLSLNANLLPAELRAVNSRALYIPTIVLGTLVLLGAGGLWGYSKYEDSNYRKALQAEIARTEPAARKAVAMDKEIDTARRRTLMLDDFRKRTKSDLDALNELTHILAPPTWVMNLEMTRDGLRISGESDQASGLIKILDGSKFFEGSELTMPISRLGNNVEGYGIRTRRQGAMQ